MADMTADSEAPLEVIPKTQAKKTATLTGDIKNDVYAAAAECVDAVMKRRASVNSAIFNSPFEDKRFLLALTQKTVDHLPHIKKIVYDSQLLKREPRLSKAMAYVLVYDTLFGNTRKRKGIAKIIGRFEKDLQAAMAKYMKEKEVTHVSSIKTEANGVPFKPRYVRVNTLKTSTNDVIESLKKEGFTFVEYDASTISQKTFIKMLRKLDFYSFLRDFHVPDLLVFHPMVIFHQHHLETSGMIALQDKVKDDQELALLWVAVQCISDRTILPLLNGASLFAEDVEPIIVTKRRKYDEVGIIQASCLPSQLLNPPPGSHVIDACAAPGMKTAHLAALMENDGKLVAVDLNEDRCKTLRQTLTRFDVKCAEVVKDDFLKISPEAEENSSVTHILVDPTCTGSGVTSRSIQGNKKKERKTKEDRQRLQKLKGLQATLLKHALSFPKVERVVYSTCSTNAEEDEEVIQEAIKPYAASFVVRPFSRYLPSWKGCGKPRYSVGRNCLRAFTEKHLTNGFFIAVIERATVSNELEGTEPENLPSVEPLKNCEEGIHVPISVGTGAQRRRNRKRKHRDEVNEHWSLNNQTDAESVTEPSTNGSKRLK